VTQMTMLLNLLVSHSVDTYINLVAVLVTGFLMYFPNVEWHYLASATFKKRKIKCVLRFCESIHGPPQP
jgi:hypothetical protein